MQFIVCSNSIGFKSENNSAEQINSEELKMKEELSAEEALLKVKSLVNDDMYYVYTSIDNINDRGYHCI